MSAEPRDPRAAAGPDLRVGPPRGPARDAAFTFQFDGRSIAAHPGETIGASLLAAGIRHLRTTRRGGRPRGLFCGIGHCFDCLVTVNGVASQRACLTPAAPDDHVEVQDVPAVR
jgi:predicted molibdopterin-dependent oxidoreductase YjgC